MCVLNSEQLNKMSQVDIRKVDPATLVNARAVSIDTTLPQAEKVERYIKQIGNPYCFMSGDTPVQIRFVGTERALPKALQDYFSRLAQK